MILNMIERLRELYRLPKEIEKHLVLAGQNASRLNSTVSHLDDLSDIEFRVFSQWGEDGIIDWLIQKLPEIPPTFVEFGVEDYKESNTRFLLQNRLWRGLVIDGSEKNIQKITNSELYWRHNLTAIAAFITKDNINQLISGSGFSGEVGVLSVDLDGNDYWILDAIDCINPALLICEVNGALGDLLPISIPYREDFSRLKAHSSGQYFGASVVAIRRLAESKGYRFLGTTRSGVNAFFLRDELSSSILPLIRNTSSYPNQHRDSRDSAGKLDYKTGHKRTEVLSELTVYDFDSHREVSIGSLGQLYSDEWQKGRPS